MSLNEDKKGKIIVIDDCNISLLLISTILKRSGYSVSCYLEPLKFLAEVQNIKPDLIISDFIMPKMDGLMLYKEIRKVTHLKTIPFIFISGYTDNDFIHNCKALGVDEYIKKPIKHDKLLILIKKKLKE